jgi:hypothetical protein
MSTAPVWALVFTTVCTNESREALADSIRLLAHTLVRAIVQAILKGAVFAAVPKLAPTRSVTMTSAPGRAIVEA